MKSFAPSAALALLAASPAVAQESALKSAADAFGERVGIEQLGLYNEGQVRGFDLQASGAYRIDDAYLARASPLNDPVLAGVGVRVGVNAARLAYPAPSGVVNYRLREPTANNMFRIGGGLRDYGTLVAEAGGSWTSQDDQLFVTGGVIARPLAQWAAGTRGQALDVGAVFGWRPAPDQRLRGFVSWYGRDYDGDYGVTAAQPDVPATLRPRHQYSPDWARVRAQNINFGALYDGEFGPWSVDASLFRSIYALDRADFTSLSARPDGTATGTTLITPERTNIADAGEVRISRVFGTQAVSHMLSGSVRARRSTVDLATNLPVALGTFDLMRDATPSPPKPSWTGRRGEDEVQQLTASLGYGLVWDDRLQLRLGVHRTRYEKTVQAPSGTNSSAVDEANFYNASAVWSLTPRTSLFASWVTGLEETGFAPQTATNNGAVLAPVEAEQREIGVRHAVTDRLTLIGAVFEVSKPTVGFRTDGSYGLVGEASHRGVEVSLAGRVGEGTDIVFGAVSFTPEVSGELVDAGLIGDRAVGISDLVVNASIEQPIGGGWSLDAQGYYLSSRWADMRNSFQTPDVALLHIGARRRFRIEGQDAQFRLLVSNVGGASGYWASPSTFLWPIEPRTVRALLTVTFGG